MIRVQDSEQTVDSIDAHAKRRVYRRKEQLRSLAVHDRGCCGERLVLKEKSSVRGQKEQTKC